MRRVRRVLPNGRAIRKSVGRARPGRRRAVDDDLRLLRRRLLVRRGTAWHGPETEVVRMAPNRAGHANDGHACVKGVSRMATPRTRIGSRSPSCERASPIPGVATTWDEAFAHSAREFKRIQQKYGRDSMGGITSSRCTNEETFLVQKLVRAAFGNNNVDTCARVCHSPTGYGLKHTLGESAGTQAFTSVDKADVIIGHRRQSDRGPSRIRFADEAAPASGRQTDRGRSARHVHGARAAHRRGVPPAAAPGHERRRDQCARSRDRDRGSHQEDYIAARCEPEAYQAWKTFVAEPRNSPEAMERITGVPAATVRAAARMYAESRQRRDLLRPWGHRAQPGHDHGHGYREPGHGNREPRPRGRGRESVARSEQRAGCLRHGVLPARIQRLPARFGCQDTPAFESAWGVPLLADPGLRIPNMFEAALDGSFKGMYVQGEDFAQSDPNTQHIAAAMRAMEFVVVQDLFLNETAQLRARLPAGLLVPREGRHLHQCGTSHFACAQGRSSLAAGYEDWEITMMLSNALGYPMHYTPSLGDHGRDRSGSLRPSPA